MKYIFFFVLWTALSSLQASGTPTPSTDQTARAHLDEQEKAWIREHPLINFTGDPDWLPFEAFSDTGRYIGIVPDILNIIEKQTSLKFNIKPTKSWDQSVKLLESGKVDMMTVSDAWNDPKYLYTEPVLPNPIVIVMKADQPYVDSLYYLQYEDIAVIKDYRYVDQIKKKYPNYNFHDVKNIQEGLEGVATGKYDAVVASMALATYTIEKLQLNNIKVVGKTEFNIKILFAVRKDMAPLVGIINKVHIGEKKGHELLREWTYQKYVEKTDYTLITQLVMLLLIILLAAIIFYLLFKKKSRKHQSTEGLLAHIKNEIDDAERYASLLDDPALLKSDSDSDFFDDSFTVSHPRSIKSGTLSCFKKLDPDRAILIVADARGESIDGVLNALFIKGIVQEVIDQLGGKRIDPDPATVLSSLGRILHHRLEETDTRNRPKTVGFDAAAVIMEKAAGTLLYAGANISLFTAQEHQVRIVRADKTPVGSGDIDYTSHRIELIDTDSFYLFSRGYIDQIGGSQELPLGKRRIKEILGKYELQDLETQRNALVKAYKEHKGGQAMTGDIIIVGFRLNREA